MGMLSTNDQQDPGERIAQGQATAGEKQAGQAYSNYRQYNRDNSANQLSNRASLYQGLMNRMQSAYGAQGAPNVSQMGVNPMSLAQTTVGATGGSNAAGNGVGWQDYQNATGAYMKDKNGNTVVNPGANSYGLIGSMGLNQKPGQWSSGAQAPATQDMNGVPMTPGNTGINSIYTNSGPPPEPYGAPGAPPPGGFNFAPRRP